MDSRNYVAPAPGGGFDVVYNGSLVYHSATQSDAENYYNSMMAQHAGTMPSGTTTAPTTTGAKTYDTPNGPKTLAQMRTELQGAGYNGAQDDASVIAAYNRTTGGSAAGGTATGGNSQQSAQALLDAIASGNTQAAEEAIREYNQTSYQNLATSLLDTASKLTGPADYYQYQKYASGGRDLMDQLYGNQPRAAFTAPQGTNQPSSLESLMTQLGFRQAPGADGSTGSSGTHTSITPDQINQYSKSIGIPAGIVQDYVNANQALPGSVQALTDFMDKNGYRNSNGSLTGKAGPNVTGYIAPPANGTPSSTGGNLLHTMQLEQPTTVTLPDGTTRPYQATTPAGQAQGFLDKTGLTPGYRVNPINWDSLGYVGQALTKSAVGASGQDFNTWLEQLNAQRPIGTAPKSTLYSYGNAGGSNPSGPAGVY